MLKSSMMVITMVYLEVDIIYDVVCDLIVATAGRTEKASGVVRMTKEGTKSFSQVKRTIIVDNNVIPMLLVN